MDGWAIIGRLGRIFPHYGVAHLTVALGVGLVTGAPICGAAFYAGREIRDWQKAGRFDHRGFWWPVVPCLALEVAVRLRVIPWTW